MQNDLIKKGLVCTILILLLLIPSALAVNVKNGKEIVSINLGDKTLENAITKVNKNPLNSPWPMYCHDTHHSGRSQYSTADNPGDEKWRFKTSSWNENGGGPAIDANGTIYFGCNEGILHAFYENGTLKWEYNTNGRIFSVPAIASDGTIYIGSFKSGLHAIYPNGTRKWLFSVKDGILSSPVIANDDTILFTANNKIIALYPNGTEKWNYTTTAGLRSSPAVGDDGTVYIGSGDAYLYALYPNGTLRWRFQLEGNYIYVRADPSIAEDGTIYIGCSSLTDDYYLYAICPNGTFKWRFHVNWDIWSSASIGEDGTIYLGADRLYALYPNGTLKWSFNTGGFIVYSSPAISSDGTIYIGTSMQGSGVGGDIIAINPDGTEKWRKLIANRNVQSSPAIGEDGTIYVSSSSNTQYDFSYGYFHAFGKGAFKVDANGQYYGLINNPVQFIGKASNGTRSYTWCWDFGDGQTSEEQNPQHTYTSPCDYSDYYVVTLTVSDSTGNTSGDITRVWIQETNEPPWAPFIDGPTSGKPGISYDYNFETWDDDGRYTYCDIWYYIDWGDGSKASWLGPYKAYELVTLCHTWKEKGTYTVWVKAKDGYGAESDWSYLDVTMPVNQQSIQSSQQHMVPLFLRTIQRLLNIR